MQDEKYYMLSASNSFSKVLDYHVWSETILMITEVKKLRAALKHKDKSDIRAVNSRVRL